ncbi:unnamed protein product, partial [Discosporangium mesarthrocarpum]
MVVKTPTSDSLVAARTLRWAGTPRNCASVTIGALRHRTLVLHVEIKRLRSWWQKIIASGCLHRALTSATTQESGRVNPVDAHFSDPLGVLADTRELLDAQAPGELVSGGRQQQPASCVCILADRVGQSADPSPWAAELAALICGLGSGWRVDLAWLAGDQDQVGALSRAPPGIERKALQSKGLSSGWL